VPPSLPFWYLLFPQGRELRAGFVPRPGLTCGASCLDGLPSSESVALSFTGPVSSRRSRSEVRAARADRVRALVGRRPASPGAACPIGGAVAGVTGPGRPEGRWVVHASAYPGRAGPVGKASQREPGRDTSAWGSGPAGVDDPAATHPWGVLFNAGLPSLDQRGGPGGHPRIQTRPRSGVDGGPGPVLWHAGT
jgi:hypothetical protein